MGMAIERLLEVGQLGWKIQGLGFLSFGLVHLGFWAQGAEFRI